VEVEHAARTAGKSNYRLYDLIRLNFDLVTGFSMVPLQIFTIIGMAISVLSMLFVVYFFIRRLMIGPEAEGVFTLFAILYFLVGIVVMGLGIIGEYIGRIYKDIRRRPRFVIRKVYERLDE
jgi:undecaprenyl-phosphate 4-deoxy-4-formamido-L-arabinose transferase